MLNNQFISDFFSRLEKKEEAGAFVQIHHKAIGTVSETENRLAITIPMPYRAFFQLCGGIVFNGERDFEIFSMRDWEILEDGTINIASVNSIPIFATTKNINSAGEWDIGNMGLEFIITKTFASLLTNKIWAWIDRGRRIWEMETY